LLSDDTTKKPAIAGFFVCARHGRRLAVKSFGELVTASEANRSASDRETGVKEAGSEAAADELEAEGGAEQAGRA
jgi:hypothetical protein